MLYAEDVPNQLLQRFRSVQKQHLGRRSRPAKLQAGKPLRDWRFLQLIARDGVACQIHRHHVDAGLG